MENNSIFGVEPEKLKELLSMGDDERDGPGPQNERPSLREKRPPDKESKPPKSKATMDALIEQPGSWIGPYKLLSVLGEGGMGMAYLAEQKQPIRRQVAIKVIKPGMDSRRVVSRFEAERQALALLDHPNIAHVYDAGTTELGRPYFVMEYVKGLPITDYCDYHKLTIEDRLHLFLQVCQAVQHAHQKGIIHRDIKPSNILVSEENDRPIPKIIDFGVAKALGRPLSDRTVFTEDSQLLGTPEYMSPEQADMAKEDIDTRSDVYSLGVLLYVLLTGVLPFESETLRDSGIENIRRTIRETDPKTPSTRLTSLGDEAAKVAERRSTEISTLTRNLKKELEWIPLKAMRKERSERYRSASELADDIENYLKGDPLIAGPPTIIYRFKKFLRRHSSAVIGIAALLVVLVGGTITSTIFAISTQRALSQAQAVSSFLQDILDPGSFSEVQESDLNSILDIATQRLEGKFEDQPLDEASIRYTLGSAYRNIGKYGPALQHLDRAYQIYLQHHGPGHGRTTHAAHLICHLYCSLGHYEDAIQMWIEQIEIMKRVRGEDNIWGMDLLCMCNIGNTYLTLGRYEEAEAWLDKVMELIECSRSLRRWFVFHQAIQYRGENYLALGRYQEAEKDMNEAVRLSQKRNGLESDITLDRIRILSEIYRAQGRYEEARQLCKTTLDTMHRALSDKHSKTLRGMCSLAGIFTDLDLLDEAEELLREALKGQQHKLGDEHDDTLKSMNALAVLLRKKGNYDEAERLFEEVWKVRWEKWSDDHPDILTTINDFGVLRREQKNYEESESLLRQALNGRQLKLGNDHPSCFESIHELAVLYKEQDDYDRAEPLLIEALKGRRLKLGDTHPHTLESLNTLTDLYETSGKPEKAKEWRAKLPEAEAVEE